MARALQLVDEIFPALQNNRHEREEYNDMNFWRASFSLGLVDEADLERPKPAAAGEKTKAAAGEKLKMVGEKAKAAAGEKPKAAAGEKAKAAALLK